MLTASGLVWPSVCVIHLGQGLYFIGDYSNEQHSLFVEERWLTWSGSGLFEKLYDETLRSCCSIIVRLN